MIAFAYYLLKVIAGSGILFLYYHFFLRNRLFHQWNRFYLLTSVVLSLSLPFIKLDWTTPHLTSTDLLNYLLFIQSADRYMEEYIVYYQPRFSTEDWVMLGYIAVSAGFLITLSFSIYKIIRLVRNHESHVFDQFILLPTREPGSPFSFLHYIFWNEDIPLHSSPGQQIFRHELVHVKEKHTLDKLFIQIVLVLFWCNPFFWLIRKELRFLHEFIADEKAVGNDAEAFAKMILQAAYPNRIDAIRNPFFQSSIKRRLHMLTQVKNPKLSYLGRLAALLLIATMFFAFTVKTNTHGRTAAQALWSVNATDTIPQKAGISAIDVRKNKEKNISEIEISYTDGRREVLTEKEAMDSGLIQNDYSNRKTRVFNGPGQKAGITIRDTANLPLFVLDGKEVDKSALNRLNPNMIESINVLKDASATAIYGEKGKNGVVEINTKKQTSNEPISLQENGEEVLKGKITSVELTKPNNVKIEADEITVTGKKLNKEEQVTIKGDVTVQGYGKLSGKGEMTFVADSLEVHRVFENAEFAPSVDREEWRAFLEKHTTPIIAEVGQKAAPGRYTVYVRFIVERDGSITNASTLNDPGYELSSKVLGIMKYAPKWKPAIQNKQVVRSYHTQPITFVIRDVKT